MLVTRFSAFFLKQLSVPPSPQGSMWEYWHSYSRWVVGATHNRAWGGIMIKPYDGDVACPWMLKWFRTQRWSAPQIWTRRQDDTDIDM